MILRRVIAHFRKQEWTAIALDFVIVVMGVFVGIQVSNWNEGRAMDARATGYLQRIHDDLGIDILNYGSELIFRQTVAEEGVLALSAESNGDSEADWRRLRAFFNASQMSGRPNIDTTYAELTSSGELALIANEDLRAGLSRYYTVAGANPALQGMPAYRETVRGMIPATIQQVLWRECYRADGDAFQEFIACEPAVDANLVSKAVERMATSERLRDELNYWISTQEVAAIIIESRREQAEVLQSIIASELNDNNSEKQ
ncbi:hypothetical protein [Hyphococcus sp.]|uniref:hypothetical protein n=1 Tax=Hyphococcus sp. TaxID=2038636 RepID=UPI002088A3B2|nr:MAG: hypothetical protein DHS20C04_10020 [Marinicaulis sp.]